MGPRYEPFSVIFFESSLTVALGVLVVMAFHERSLLMDWKSIRRVLPVGATYALGDLMDLAAARNVSGTTLMVAAQLRLPLCALLRWGLLGRNQTKLQRLAAMIFGAPTCGPNLWLA